MSLMQKVYKHAALLDSLFPSFQRLPDIFLRAVAHEFVKRAKRGLDDGGPTCQGFPHHLIFFVTNRCNLKCDHCFYSDQLNKPEGEMTIDQIKMMAASLSGKLSHLELTGGEPFIRDDLVDICIAFEELAAVQSVTILTNGFMPDRIEGIVRKILEGTSLTLNFQISLDGPRFIHDAMRSGANSFDNAIRTIEKLQGLRHKNRIQRIKTLTTLGQANYGHIEETIRELKKIKNVSYGFNFVRGALHDTVEIFDKSLLSNFDPRENLYLTVDQMKHAIEKIDSLLWKQVRTNLYYAENRALLKLFIKLKEGDLSGFQCMAGIADFVIYPDGDIALCEMLKSVGNIRKYNFDVTEAVSNELFNLKGRLRCKCAHSCNLLSMIMHNEEKLYELFKN